ncbi:FGGY-family carbohydrate kinase [Solibacillus sp. FSL W7-1464]|uniref:rhamnulokinase n=1 Tax=Solibacillus sp. FSL W7-1464 TaxID=2921706 RepID=UPI0030F7C1B1
MVTVLAYDLGASNGRLTAQHFNGKTIKLKEVHRFTNEPFQKEFHYYWDYERLIKELHIGLQKAAPDKGKSIGIDTWGVDFACLNKDSQLIQNPLSYRDKCSVPYVEKVQKIINHYDLYTRTGNEISSINTLFQLMAIDDNYNQLLDETENILLMPSLLMHALSGEKINELTIGSTTQLLNLKSENWDNELIEKLFNKQLPLSPIGQTHEIIGKLIQFPTIQMALVPGHDTACALSALPIEDKNGIFISLGTWGLIGMELEEAVVSLEAFQQGFTNERTSEKMIRFQKNATGFWILQKLRKEWQQQQVHTTFEHEEQAYYENKEFRAIINPEDEVFFNPVSMVNAIHEFCKKTNQSIPISIAEQIRCFSESLAIYYANIIDDIERITGYYSPTLYIGGGGAKNKLLCQLIANASGKRVVAGPVEASSLGNGLSQLRALGEISNLQEGRDVIKASFTVTEYEPQEADVWKSLKVKYKNIFRRQ